MSFFARSIVCTSLFAILILPNIVGCADLGPDQPTRPEAVSTNQANVFSCTDPTGNGVVTSGGTRYNGILPSYITTSLTTTEMSVATAYLALFGRAPDLGGLNYWSGMLGANATVTTAVTSILNGMSGALLAPVRFTGASSDPNVAKAERSEYVEYVYAGALGKSVEDDRCGIAYWADQLSINSDRAALITSILNAAAGTTDPYSYDMWSNRMLAVEAATRAQKQRMRSLDAQDSETLVRRVTDTLSSYNDAMNDLDRLTQGIASPVNQWDQAYSPDTVGMQALPLNNTSSVKEHKYLVWYNRQGQMLLAHVFLPPGYPTASTYRAIVSVHGGAWREGFIEKLQKYNAAIAQQNYVVFSPAYRLTNYGYASPAEQNDVEDFISLVKNSSSMFKIDPTRVGLFGESAGGHLVNLLGSKSNMRCVSTIYPVSDLSDPWVYDPKNGDANLIQQIQYYVGNDWANQRAVSPTYTVVAGVGTKFHIQHGTADTIVPPSQTDAFQANALGGKGVSVTVTKVTPLPDGTDGGHGFYDAYTPGANLTNFNGAVSALGAFFVTCL